MKNSNPIKRLSLIASGVALSTCVLAVDRANAQPIVLDFEGLNDGEQIGNFYDGGLGGSLGVLFEPGAQAFTSVSAGGNGNFINEPSKSNAAIFLNAGGPQLVMNVPAGFSGGFSFFYSSAASTSPRVRVYEDQNGGGNLLAEIVLSENAFNNNCDRGPDPFAPTLCNWDPIGVDFPGIAKSVIFPDVPNQIYFDNITLGSNTPGQVKVPEPASVLGLLAIGALGAGSALTRKLLK